ncbi:YHS domain-containing (seleno)protein [uncultured Enterovirga sp.]|uniref:YHS domain-containing (seleno)protein n=1 Tax=uncultured Enterovirga sp. TaxID=2026352 RepID=UPI0035CAE8AE
MALLAPVAAGAAHIFPFVVGTTELIDTDRRSGLALSGYDPVAYQADGRALPGVAAHEEVFAGVAWRFSSGANRAAFLRDPSAFLPRIGGYDAIAAAGGRVVSADPLLFALREGRLYLFRTEEGRRRFLADDGGPAASERGWSRIRGELVAD